jgi:colanic acid biosynthesis glycosyl transferase WcaI
VRILVLGINYTPERTSVAPFTTGLCEHLAAQGHEVTVITAFPYYPEWRVWDEYRGQFCRKETLNGVGVVRVWHYVPRRPSRLFQRLAYDTSFAVHAFFRGLWTGDCDLIYCVSPPPMAAVAAYALARIKRVPYVIKLTDLASDAALATGIVRSGFKIRLARGIERFIYDRAARIACLCEGFIGKLAERGVASSKLHLIPDWADTESVRPVIEVSPFRRSSGVGENQFLVLHTGNMGKKQDLLNIVNAAELSQADLDLVWMLVGEGEERQLIEKESRSRGLGNLKLLPLQPAGLLRQVYSAADVLVLNQKASLKEAVIPSKLLTYMAAGRPVVAAVSEQSEAARHIRASHCGFIVQPESPEALVQGVLLLRQNPSLRLELGANGRKYALEHFTKSKVFHGYEAFFLPWSNDGKPVALPHRALDAPEQS